MIKMTPFDALSMGTRIIESPYAMTAGDPVIVRRTWRERLLTRPWRPLRATRTETPMVPCVVRLNESTIVAHPSIAAALRKQFGVQH